MEECRYHQDVFDTCQALKMQAERSTEKDVAMQKSLARFEGKVDSLCEAVNNLNINLIANYATKTELKEFKEKTDEQAESFRARTDKHVGDIYDRMDENLKHNQVSTYRLIGIVIGTSSVVSAVIFGVFSTLL